MTFRPGDRVRFECEGEDGFPVVRYGFVGDVVGPDGDGGRGGRITQEDRQEGKQAGKQDGKVVVMLDGELNGHVIDVAQIRPVTITTVELCLAGRDLVAEADLRRGLVALWHAEADSAGLDVDALHPLGDGLRESSDSWVLAELTAGGDQYVVRAFQLPHEPDVVRIRADLPQRWIL